MTLVEVVVGKAVVVVGGGIVVVLLVEVVIVVVGVVVVDCVVVVVDVVVRTVVECSGSILLNPAGNTSYGSENLKAFSCLVFRAV